MKLLLVLAMSTIVCGSVYAECKVDSLGDCSTEKVCNDLNGTAKTKTVMWSAATKEKPASCVKIDGAAVTDCSGVLNTAPGAKGSTAGDTKTATDAAATKDK